jgi:protein transport protein SEC13
MATAPLVSFDTQHEDMIHDAQIDYYSRKLATASSDRTVKIWDVHGEKYSLAETLKGHDGPVWQVAWAHPKFGVLLASCSYDGKVIIHRESPGGVWSPIHIQNAHEASVNSVSWAPHEYGLILGCASADGTITILKHNESDTWGVENIPDPSRLGCNALSWAPVSTQGGGGGQLSPLKFVTGSCDNHVRVWTQGNDGSWTNEELPSSHDDWVRDVAWAPNTSSNNSMIASCSEDRTVVIWTQSQVGGEWTATPLCKPFDCAVWRVSWSVTGNLLAVSAGDQKVTLWKQALDGKWENVSHVNDQGQETKMM